MAVEDVREQTCQLGLYVKVLDELGQYADAREQPRWLSAQLDASLQEKARARLAEWVGRATRRMAAQGSETPAPSELVRADP